MSRNDSNDSTVRLWNMATGQEVLRLKGQPGLITSAAFSPDGKRIVTGSTDDTGYVWDAATGKELLRLQGHKALITSVVFSPDGKRIATASGDMTSRLWDTQTGVELLRLTIRNGRSGATAVAFSPDGKQFLTAYGNGTTRFWRKMSDGLVLSLGRKQQQEAERAQQAAREEAAITRLKESPLEALLENAQVLLTRMPELKFEVGLVLNNAAWSIVDPVNPVPTPEKAKTALQIVEKSVALSEGRDAATLDTLAAARFVCGNIDGALEAERMALKAWPNDSEIKAQLAKYEKLLAEKQKGKR